jgi:hypothetical protein
MSTSLTAWACLGDFALTATAIARQVGIITTPPAALHGIANIPLDTPLDQIPKYIDSDGHTAPTSFVLSGPELNIMTAAQWEQLLLVRMKLLHASVSDLSLDIVSSMTRSYLLEQALSKNCRLFVLFSRRVARSLLLVTEVRSLNDTLENN